MPTLVGGTPQYDPVNNTFIWVCTDSNGAIWVRTPDGNWGQADVSVLSNFSDVQADFANFTAQNQPAPAATLEQSDTDASIAAMTPNANIAAPSISAIQTETPS